MSKHYCVDSSCALWCPICSNTELPILLEEIEVQGEVHKTTTLEKEIAKVTRFFDANCRKQMLDPYDLARMDTDNFLWDLANIAVQYVNKNSVVFTHYVHHLSCTFPNITVEFYKAAKHFNVLDTYKQFLPKHGVIHFWPTDIELL